MKRVKCTHRKKLRIKYLQTKKWSVLKKSLIMLNVLFCKCEFKCCITVLRDR